MFTTSILCAWLLIYPHYNNPDASEWANLWNSIQYRNAWIAAFAYAEKTPCVTEAWRLREVAKKVEKGPVPPDYAEENRAKAQALCVPAEVLDILPLQGQGQPPGAL